MFTIHYILNDRISFQKCKDEIELKIIYRALMKQKAKIIVVRNQFGQQINKILT